MTPIELFVGALGLAVILVELAALWILSGRYLLMLRRALTASVRRRRAQAAEIRHLRAQLAETEAALQRATGGTDAILAAVRGPGRHRGGTA